MVLEKIPKKPRVNVNDLNKDWDQCESIRTYLRENPDKPLLHENVKHTVVFASKPWINDILYCILLRSCGVVGQPQPSVRALREQLALLYKRNKRDPDDGIVIDDSWHIRKFLVLIKGKTKKQLVSTVPLTVFF